jgi:hypothetical protein
MSVNDIKILLTMAKNLLATAEKLSSGPARNNALRTIQEFAAEIARRMGSWAYRNATRKP